MSVRTRVRNGRKWNGMEWERVSGKNNNIENDFQNKQTRIRNQKVQYERVS